MKNEVSCSIEKFKKAYLKLKEGIDAAENELDQDGVIQRFEFTFEALWKCLKVYLEDKGLLTRSPKEALKEAFRLGIIDDEKAFLDMLKDRNFMSHIYDEEKAKKVFQNIKLEYLEPIAKVLLNLQKN